MQVQFIWILCYTYCLNEFSLFVPFICCLFLFYFKCLPKGFTYLVFEVLKNTLLATNILLVLPNQLLDLIFYGSSFVGLPTLIVTTNFGDDLLSTSDKSEIYLQYVDYLHESLTKSPSDSFKLNLKTNANMVVHFLHPYIL